LNSAQLSRKLLAGLRRMDGTARDMQCDSCVIGSRLLHTPRIFPHT
jgi:hypothetical protein